MRLAVDIELDSKKAGLCQNPIIGHFGKHISSPHTDLDFKACMDFCICGRTFAPHMGNMP